MNKTEFQKKITILRQILKKHDANTLLLKSDDSNFKRLFEHEIENAVLLVNPKTIILLTKRLEHLAKEYANKNISIIQINKSIELKELMRKQKLGVVLTNYDNLTLNDKETFNLKKTINCLQDLLELRSQKTDNEIKKIKIACNHTVKCWSNIITKLQKKEFKTEKQIEKYIKIYAIQNNLGLAFNPIIASGKNAGVPHHKPQNKLNKGFLVIDVGFDFEGYKSDMTRTIYLGKPSKGEKEIYVELLKVQETMIKEVKIGKKTQELYEQTLKLMKKPELFIHGLGHGVGLDIHENPSITKKTDDIIKKYQILTIEPGYYTKNYGIRIEDTILVSETNKILTKKASKKLKIIQ